MKNIKYIAILLLFSVTGFAQVAPDPTGDTPIIPCKDCPVQDIEYNAGDGIIIDTVVVDNQTTVTISVDKNFIKDCFACITAEQEGTDICAALAADPNDALASLDCDFDGQSNSQECAQGTDPNDICDNTLTREEACDLAAIDPVYAALDCDMGGVINSVECADPATYQAGPNDASDDVQGATISLTKTMLADTAAAGDNVIISLTVCETGGSADALMVMVTEDLSLLTGLTYVSDDGAGNFNSPNWNAATIPAGTCKQLNITMVVDAGASLGTIDNATSASGSNTNSATAAADVVIVDCTSFANGAELCEFIEANPNSNLANADCDNGGVQNDEDCAAGGDPFDDSDDAPCTQLTANIIRGLTVACDMSTISYTGDFNDGANSYGFTVQIYDLATGTLVASGVSGDNLMVPSIETYDDWSTDIKGYQLVIFPDEFSECNSIFQVFVPSRTNTATCVGSPRNLGCTVKKSNRQSTGWNIFTPATACEYLITMDRWSAPCDEGDLWYSTRYHTIGNVPTNVSSMVEYFDGTNWVVDGSASNTIIGTGHADKDGAGYSAGDMIRVSFTYTNNTCGTFTQVETYTIP